MYQRARARARARCIAIAQTQAARGINKLVHVWFVCQIKVPMGTTDWHKKQGSGVLNFLREAFMLQCISARARAASHNSVTELICKSGPCYLVY